MRRSILAMLVVAQAMLSGCAGGKPLNLSGDSFSMPEIRSGGTRKGGPAPLVDNSGPGGCPVILGKFEDKRRNRNSLGTVAGRSISISNIEGLVEQGMLYTFSRVNEVEFIEIQDSEHPAITVQGEILKAYMKGVATSMVANVALRIEFVMPDGTSEKFLSRGTDTSLNWVSGDGELTESLSRAMVDALEMPGQGLIHHCNQVAKRNDLVPAGSIESEGV